MRVRFLPSGPAWRKNRSRIGAGLNPDRRGRLVGARDLLPPPITRKVKPPRRGNALGDIASPRGGISAFRHFKESEPDKRADAVSTERSGDGSAEGRAREACESQRQGRSATGMQVLRFVPRAAHVVGARACHPSQARGCAISTLRPPTFPPVAQKQSTRLIIGRPWRTTRQADHFGRLIARCPARKAGARATRPSLRYGPAPAALTISALRAPSATFLSVGVAGARRSLKPEAVGRRHHRQPFSSLQALSVMHRLRNADKPARLRRGDPLFAKRTHTHAGGIRPGYIFSVYLDPCASTSSRSRSSFR